MLSRRPFRRDGPADLQQLLEQSARLHSGGWGGELDDNTRVGAGGYPTTSRGAAAQVSYGDARDVLRVSVQDEASW